MRRPLLLALALPALLALGAAATLVLARPGRAEDKTAYELRFIALTGEGSTTKAWFEGAPATGVRAQEALDRFTQEGFRFVSLTPAWRQGVVNVSSSAPSTSAPSDAVFVLLLERGR